MFLVFITVSRCCVSLQGSPGPNGDIGPEGPAGKKVSSIQQCLLSNTAKQNFFFFRKQVDNYTLQNKDYKRGFSQ